MSDGGKIYADASQPATLRRGVGSVECLTLQEAVLAWMGLSEKEREEATIKVNVPGGPVYTASEIARLYNAPRDVSAKGTVAGLACPGEPQPPPADFLQGTVAIVPPQPQAATPSPVTNSNATPPAGDNVPPPSSYMAGGFDNPPRRPLRIPDDGVMGRDAGWMAYAASEAERQSRLKAAAAVAAGISTEQNGEARHEQLLELNHIMPKQKIAPAQFEIRNGKLALAKIPMYPPEEDRANVLAARGHLRASAENILSELERSNCDRRLIENVRSLQELLKTEDGNIIQLGLANIGCEVMCSSFKDELPVAVASMLQAHTKGVQLFVGQFPEWHRFIENAATVQLVNNDITELHGAVTKIVGDLQQRPDLVEPEVPKTLARINELLNAPGVAGKRAAFALLRSVENLISKVFSYVAEFCDKTASKVVDSASGAVAKVVYIGLLTLALEGAYAISPVAGKVSEMQWVKTAVDIVQKQLATLLKEATKP
jgi:hypothetical protein